MRRRIDPSINGSSIAIDRATGKVRWTQTAYRGVPREKRHIKSTYANQTPATDGDTVVAFFGSQGLYAYDMKGALRWKQDLGVLNAGAYDLPEYEWGNASSPIVADGRVIVQCDVHGSSFLQAFDVKTGRSLWKTERTELPSWATPTVVAGPQRQGAGDQRAQLHSRVRPGHRPAALAAGRQLEDHGAHADSRRRSGDRRLGPRARAAHLRHPAGQPRQPHPASGQTTSEAIAWSKTQRGPYMPTPLAYGDQLYTLANQGLFDAYTIAGGAEVYRQRLPHAGSGFSASPVASDGRLFVSSEDGDVFVVKAGPSFELLAKNAMSEPIMATPAIAGSLLIVRTEKQLVAIGRYLPLVAARMGVRPYATVAQPRCSAATRSRSAPARRRWPSPRS